jgi:glycosyltransferase involved in cell wall biosynthesis
MVEHERTGLLRPIADDAGLAAAVTRLLDDRPLRSRLVAGAAERLNDFTTVATARKTRAEYQSVLDGTGGRPKTKRQ